MRVYSATTAATLLADIGPDGRAKDLMIDRTGRWCAITLLGAPHPGSAERLMHHVWVNGPALRGPTEAELWT